MLGIDANVLVYAADGSEGTKHVRCRQIMAAALAAERAFIPAQALAEFVWVRTRKQQRPLPETLEFADTWRALSRVAGYDARDVATAAETAHRHTIMFWDALIWAVCDRVGIAQLVTEDFQDGRRLGGVTFLNPFNPDNAARLGLTQPVTRYLHPAVCHVGDGPVAAGRAALLLGGRLACSLAEVIEWEAGIARRSTWLDATDLDWPLAFTAARAAPFDQPRLMGILNVTPDSFSDGGAHADTERAVAHGLRLAEQGADIVDVGGEFDPAGCGRGAGRARSCGGCCRWWRRWPVRA